MTGGVDVKLCGLSTPAQVAAALDAGPRWLGFVVFARSPRHVAPDDLAALTAPAAGRAERVAVLVDPDDGLVDRVAGAVDVLQLHGGETPERVAAIARRSGRAVWKAWAVGDRLDVEAVNAYAGAVDRFLFDAKPPKDAALPGGNGVAFNAALLRGVAVARPWILSGGLDAASLGPAVARSGARAVDVSSGVEEAPGVKSASLMAAFVAAARTLEPANA
ncbi:phosphoribosylanthranilate isomerase [Rhodothalassium salexigens DSM 2132]|uniref:N-(5'-phosphoribosyl)anthranilate isomerase n=1 Tax=Rhodothalassium salexigens DSM 2132 TaxID=1188247 RepID=A0A4R2PGW6_RHOSA|nr:phosphoribosylanthranilate isomerase [Rhodothalassium salexigens]MBK1638389.1 phosphoribosylanthranilate isomerase [Rhodothalassium salexigens DSM 2132]TCP34477.1 phosphoribosylanthranilate isomerase [Rhodothalassium salexigens DSM 2132]